MAQSEVTYLSEEVATLKRNLNIVKLQLPEIEDAKSREIVLKTTAQYVPNNISLSINTLEESMFCETFMSVNFSHSNSLNSHFNYMLSIVTKYINFFFICNHIC